MKQINSKKLVENREKKVEKREKQVEKREKQVEKSKQLINATGKHQQRVSDVPKKAYIENRKTRPSYSDRKNKSGAVGKKRK